MLSTMEGKEARRVEAEGKEAVREGEKEDSCPNIILEILRDQS